MKIKRFNKELSGIFVHKAAIPHQIEHQMKRKLKSLVTE
jgi:hypothetical protein